MLYVTWNEDQIRHNMSSGNPMIWGSGNGFLSIQQWVQAMIKF